MMMQLFAKQLAMGGVFDSILYTPLLAILRSYLQTEKVGVKYSCKR